ncbi:BatA domain-containing protein, partial [Robiginitalea sp.]|uniref:BatA domain-containing protein n=1 Tax=Robiginitalea sp. TaxID=1902411 RepID=UPI003C6056DA
MQLQYPELLWGLLLLILPILVHLLRLRRYRKTPFTNVKVLQKIFSESNRSSQLKKWLLLLMRLGLISALVIAFCKPYIPSETVDNKKDIVVYLDNSFSMQARWKNSNLLEHAAQEILQNFPEDLSFSFLTQSESFTQVGTKDLQQKLLNLEFSPTTLTAEEIQLRTATLFSGVDSTEQELWVFSDFTGWNPRAWENWNGTRVKAIPLEAEARKNISIDSAFIGQLGLETLDLIVHLTSDSELDNSAISLYNKDVLIAKTGVEPQAGGGLEARFTIPADTELAGTLQVSDTDLFYDNTLYVSLSKPGKIRVLSIGTASADYLGRIFTSDTFIFSQSTLRELDYSTIEEQHLVILNELETLPASLNTALKDFAEQAGNLIVIPSENAQTSSFNGFLRSFGGGLGERTNTETLITSIQFEHPVFKDVFEREIQNFEYPKTRMHYAIQGAFQPVIDFQDGSPFLAGRDGIYI